MAHYQYCTKLKKKCLSLQITKCSCLEKLRCIRHKKYIHHHPYPPLYSYKPSTPSKLLPSFASLRSRRILDDFREAYYWLRQNTDERARVMSWWDYGYQIAGMANRTTLVDNNTWNNSHIALVGMAMSSNESAAFEIMQSLDVDYVLVIFGGVIGYSGDDINKFLWMVRIAEGEHPKRIKGPEASRRCSTLSLLRST